MPHVCPVHNHTMYSALDGLSTPDEVVQRAIDIGAEAVGITDHGVVSGHLAFAKAAYAKDIKPIFGVELYHGDKWDNWVGRERDQPHLIVIAATDEGLRNLWSLVDASAHPEKKRWVCRVSWDDLAKYSRGVVATSGCALGKVPNELMQGEYDALNRYLEIYQENFYMEISTYPGDKMFNDPEADDEEPRNTEIINSRIVEVAQERGAPLIYGDDGHYAFPEQYYLHDAYLVSGTGKATKKRAAQTIWTPTDQRSMWHPEGAVCIKDHATVLDNLSYLPESAVAEAISNAIDLGKRVDAHLPEVRPHLPTFIPSECSWLDEVEQEKETVELFVDLVERGIIHRYGDEADQEVWDRAVYEMGVLIDEGLESYFLIAWDQFQFCDAADVERGPGRGSSAGSIVAYALGITDVDPLHYGLIFERFWNAGRADGFPDIDSDFAKSKRKPVQNYLTDRWGKGRVKAIGTVSRMKPIAVVNRFWAACGVDKDDWLAIKAIVEKTPDIDIHGPSDVGWSEEIDPGKKIYVMSSMGEDIVNYVSKLNKDRMEKVLYWLDVCENLCSRVENYGIHASGIIISDCDLDDEMPCYVRGEGETAQPATQFAMDDVDGRKFLKLDVLGLRTLDTLADWREQMAEKGIDIRWSGLDREEYPIEMWELLDYGFAAGIFQVNDGAVRRLCMDLKIRSVEELAVLTALNRPGPWRANVPDRYVARKNGTEPVIYDHPILEPILKDTYGLWLYQEEIIAFFNALGYTLGESDAVRKILGKKKPSALVALHDGTEVWEGRGYMEMAEAAGISTETAQKIWDDLEGFASYSFNKSHSVCYGVIAFRTLFAKFYGPAEFYRSCIRTVPNDKKALWIPLYVNEARRYGISVNLPDIMRSEADVSVKDGEILFGFSDVKGVSGAGEWIVHFRDVEGYDVSTQERFTEQLEEAGKVISKARAAAKKAGEQVDKSQKTPKQLVPANRIAALHLLGAWDSVDPREVTMRERQRVEAELLQIVISDDSADVIAANQDEIEECDGYDELLDEYEEDSRYTVPGVVTRIVPLTTKKDNKPMGRVTIEFEGDEVTFAVFNKQWKNFKNLFRERTVGIFTLRHNERGYNFESGHRLTT